MGSARSFILITAAAIALPSIASAQEQTVFVTGGAMQDREQRVTVLGAMQDREQRVTVLGAAQDREQRVTVLGAAQDREQRVTVLGAAQEREQRVTVIGAAQDRDQRVTVIGAANDQRPSARPSASLSLPTIPVVYEDEPAPATARPAGQAPAAQPNR